MTESSSIFDGIIIGGGAAGLMCARSAALRGKKILVLEKQKKLGKKIAISGGGRCNFTNYFIDPESYISQNKHFPISALQRFTQYDFLDLIEKYKIPFHEREHGQLFCNNSAHDITQMLYRECISADVIISKNSPVVDIVKSEDFFFVNTHDNQFKSKSVVIATGGLSFPRTGSDGFGYTIAKKFGINLIPRRPGLVPLELKNSPLISLSGIALEATLTVGKQSFTENLLFTHKGISGPSVLQISNYWNQNNTIMIDFLPRQTIESLLLQWEKERPKAELKTTLSEYLPKRLISTLLSSDFYSKTIKQLSKKDTTILIDTIHNWPCTPTNSSGYNKAEVTLGGIDTKELSSKTMECKNIKGLYFIGETVDVTGWLGGFNFQWAWSSGHCAGLYI